MTHRQDLNNIINRHHTYKIWLTCFIYMTIFIAISTIVAYITKKIPLLNLAYIYFAWDISIIGVLITSGDYIERN